MAIEIDRAGPVREGEELDLPRLEAYLLERLPGTEGPLEVQQFPAGFSNLTYLLTLGSRRLVLRRPPFGNPVKSAHDMGREYRVLSSLFAVYEPAPRPFLYCQDGSVIGDEFYVMERRRGVVLRDVRAPGELESSPELVRRLCESFTDNLARLHTLDYEAAGLGDLGKPDGYVGRQVTGWTKRYFNARTDDFPEVERLADWLAANLRTDGPPGLIHNDYKYNNLMLDPEDLTRIVAVLDWEMATIGDPLMDLGGALAYWVESGDSAARRQSAFGPTMLPGSFTRRELVGRYAAKTGFEVADVLFYYCFGLFKLAVIIQQIYARYVRGHTRDPRFAGLDRMVQSLGVNGMEAIEAGTV